MKTTINHLEESYQIDLNAPLDLSIEMQPTDSCVRAWYVDPITIKPVVGDGFIGDVNQGGNVNFRDIKFNPHGNGTHTECVGHISKEKYNINDGLKKYFFVAQIITVTPTLKGDDHIIDLQQFEGELLPNIEAIIIRTTPNGDFKKTINYSATNPAFLDKEVVKYLVKEGIEHLLIDLPSVDQEEDEGELICHHIMWDYPNNTQTHKTITELIYVPDFVKDGLYILNLQLANFQNDATPSRPVVFAVG